MTRSSPAFFLDLFLFFIVIRKAVTEAASSVEEQKDRSAKTKAVSNSRKPEFLLMLSLSLTSLVVDGCQSRMLLGDTLLVCVVVLLGLASALKWLISWIGVE